MGVVIFCGIGQSICRHVGVARVSEGVCGIKWDWSEILQGNGLGWIMGGSAWKQSVTQVFFLLVQL